MRHFLSTALLCTIATVVVPTASQVDASAADGCLPTNGLMNINDADDLLAGTVRVSSSETVQIGSGNVNWGRTSLSDGSARLLYSLKWVEELVREHRRTGSQRYLDRAVELVLDFTADNPVDGGPDPADAWYPMYAGQRTTAIACVAAVTSNSAVDAALATHAGWLAGQVDGLRAWNQAIDPHLGLLMGGCALDVESWRNQSRAGFGRLIRGMIDADGVLTEQAPGYGRFVWERWGVVAAELADCGLAVPAEIPARRAALLEWLAWMSAPDGTTTPIGDSYRTIVPPTPAGSPTAYTVPGGTSGTAPSGTVRVFDGGYVVGRDTWANLSDSTYWTVRFGPSRDLHGHEDHTSVTYWVDGREVLVDSGHGGYSDASYRAALLGPDAHNVLMLPGVDFRVRRSTTLVRSGAGPGWRFDEVRDDVFGIQSNKLIHAPRTRGVLVLPDDDVMVVQDRASRTSSGLFEQLWHLVPGATVVSSSRSHITARHPSGDVDVHVMQIPLPGQELPQGSTSLVEGQTDPTLGWVSDSNGHREPAPVVRMRRVGTETRLVTVIAVTPAGTDSPSRTARSVPGGWVVDLGILGTNHAIGIAADGNMYVGAPEPIGGVVPVSPARLFDSRPGVGDGTVDGLFEGGGRVRAGSVTEFQVGGRDGVPDGALAAMLNVTAVSPSAPGFLTVFDCGSAVPNASNVNYQAGQVVPNSVLAKLTGDGRLCVYSLAETDLIVDVGGYVPAGASPVPVSPARLFDSRPGVGDGTVDGLFEGGGRVRAGSVTEFQVGGRDGVPDGALAAMLNVTAVSPSAPGFLTVFDCGSAVPNASNVNYQAGQVVPNSVLAKLTGDGRLCVYSLAETDLIVDVGGYVE